jgi:hypothetical protein
MAYKARPDSDLKALAESILTYPTIASAGPALGIHPNSAWRIVTHARARGLVPPQASAATPTHDPQEARNEAFWKKRAQELAKELADTRHTLDQVSGLMSRAPNPPQWNLPKTGRRNRASGLLTISDIHAGEVIRPDEVGGLNEFNLEICRSRLRRLFGAAISILPRWASDCRLEGIHVALNGDLVSGDIHDELRRTNALTAQEQVWFVGDELAAGLKKLADAFGCVFVCITPGNHGRSTLKTHAKGTSSLSYDTMVGESLRRYFEHDKRITVMVSPARDAVYEILGWRVLQTHNDQGGGGGQGFAGPMLPILRKGKSVEWMAAQSRVFYDILVTGHYHTSGNLGKILANGSVVGYGEFAQSIRAAPEVAQQWLALITENWCIRERTEIKLQDTRKAA